MQIFSSAFPTCTNAPVCTLLQPHLSPKARRSAVAPAPQRTRHSNVSTCRDGVALKGTSVCQLVEHGGSTWLCHDHDHKAALAVTLRPNARQMRHAQDSDERPGTTKDGNTARSQEADCNYIFDPHPHTLVSLVCVNKTGNADHSNARSGKASYLFVGLFRVFSGGSRGWTRTPISRQIYFFHIELSQVEAPPPPLTLSPIHTRS